MTQAVLVAKPLDRSALNGKSNGGGSSPARPSKLREEVGTRNGPKVPQSVSTAGTASRSTGMQDDPQQHLAHESKSVVRDRDLAASFLSAADLSQSIALVSQIEETHFPADLHAPLKERLLEIAEQLRPGSKAGDERVVWSALRRAASFLDVSEANRLLSFLERSLVDTRLVALQAIIRLFAVHPPAVADLHAELGNRIWSLAEKHLDFDVFSGEEIGALCVVAIVALAAIADSRLEQAICMAKQLQRRWLPRHMREDLQELRANWLKNHAGTLVLSRLESALRILNEDNAT